MTVELPKTWTPVAVRARIPDREAKRVQDLWTELPGALVTQAEARELAARGNAYIASQFTETHQFLVIRHRTMNFQEYVRRYDQ